MESLDEIAEWFLTLTPSQFIFFLSFFRNLVYLSIDSWNYLLSFQQVFLLMPAIVNFCNLQPKNQTALTYLAEIFIDINEWETTLEKEKRKFFSGEKS